MGPDQTIGHCIDVASMDPALSPVVSPLARAPWFLRRDLAIGMWGVDCRDKRWDFGRFSTQFNTSEHHSGPQ